MTQYETVAKDAAERLARMVAAARMAGDEQMLKALRNRAARMGIEFPEADPDDEPNKPRTDRSKP